MEFLLTHPLTSLVVTIGAFALANLIYVKTGQHALATPVVTAILIMIGYVAFTQVNYETYMEGAGFVHFLLGPATVALAVPIYRQISLIGAQARAVAVGLLTTFIVAPTSAWLIARGMGADLDVQLALLPKSVTTPIAIGIAEKIDAIPAMAVFFVITGGMFGALLAFPLFSVMRLKDKRAQGFAMGAACHGIGIARAFEEGETQGVFAVLGMSLMGLISGVALPALVIWLRALG